MGMKPGKLIFKEFEDKGFDVRKFIIQLLKIPEPIKNRENILSFLKPHKPVSQLYNCEMVKTSILKCRYWYKYFKAHYTTGINTSKSNKLGLSVKHIIKLANRKPANISIRFTINQLKTSQSFLIQFWK